MSIKDIMPEVIAVLLSVGNKNSHAYFLPLLATVFITVRSFNLKIYSFLFFARSTPYFIKSSFEILLKVFYPFFLLNKEPILLMSDSRDSHTLTTAVNGWLGPLNPLWIFCPADNDELPCTVISLLSANLRPDIPDKAVYLSFSFIRL